MIFEGFRRNGLQIRIQREKLRISAPDEFLTFFEKVANFEVYNVKNSYKLSFSAIGSIKKRFLIIKTSLEHISKLILIGKTFGDVPFVIVNRIRQGRAVSRRGVPGHVRVHVNVQPRNI